MKKIAFFDMKPYDLEWFDKLNTEYEIDYYSEKLTYLTARLAKGMTELLHLSMIH